jgi:uncharacterized protein
MEPSSNACPNCAAEQRAGTLFCPKCGASQSQTPENPQPATIARTTAPSTDPKESLSSVVWLFGLMLSLSLTLGWISRITTNPWAQVAIDLGFAAVVLAFVIDQRDEILDLLKITHITPKSIVVTLATAFGTFIALKAYFAALKYFGVPFVDITESLRTAEWPLWSIVLIVSVHPAIFEELGFRGIIQTRLADIMGPKEALVIQAALFSTLHLSPVIFASHFVMGLLFGFVRQQTHSLYPGMILHAAWNATIIHESLKDVY